MIILNRKCLILSPNEKKKNKIKKLLIHNNICITESDKHSILSFLKIFNIRSLYTQFLLQQCYMIAIIVDS